MECNKEQAARAKELAERKMQSKDFIGAHKMALKAQQLFPELDNLSQMLSVCDIHCSAEHKTGGTEMDWYGILQVEISADEATIKKQFRKLALLLHPDKNKFPGAEAAFKLIGEAQRVLLDPRKRSEHDMRRKSGFRTVVRQPPPSNNTSRGRNHAYYPGASPQQQQSSDVFWTACPFCNVRYQYFRSIMNRALRCQNCMKPFIAYDMNVPASTVPLQREIPSQVYQKVVPQTGASPQVNVGVARGSVPVTDAKGQSEFAKKPAEDGNADKINGERVFGGDSYRAKVGKGANKKRGRKVVVDSSESCDTSSTDTGEPNVEVDDIARSKNAPRRSARQKQQVEYNEDSEEEDFVAPPSSKKQKKDIRNKDASSTGDFSKATDVSAKEDDRNSSLEGLADGKDQEGVGGPRKHSSFEVKAEGTSADLRTEAESDLDYPEPQFYDFDQDRMKNKFEPKQIWALFDDREGMPRFYAHINKVLSPKFKLQFTWLEPNPTDKDEVAWNEEELPVACGIFKLGDTQTSETYRMFSHLVSLEMGTTNGTYKILPRKGDVWALFKDWDISWSSDPERHRTFEFEIVEVLSDFIEGTGIKVAYLFKVKGFTSLFQRMANGGKDSFQIPPNEILRFSHRIPAYKMTGKEKSKEGNCGPKESFELDPASMPLGMQEFEPSGSLEGEVEILDAEENGSYAEHTGEDMFEKREEKDEGCLKQEYQGSGVVSPRRMNGINEKRPIIVDESPSGTGKGWGSDYDKESGDRTCQNQTSSKANGSTYQTGEKEGDGNSDPFVPSNVGVTYSLPDSEFHNFETDKTIDRFERGQFWAMYSEEDGMPKYFAWIEKIHDNSFQVQARWLECCVMSPEEKQWSKQGLPFGCGTFKLTRLPTGFSEPNIFSHQIHPEPNKRRGCYDIYPKKDEVWAVYRNWRPNWSLSELVDCAYEIVQVLSDTGQGFKVASLGKLDGYRSVFKRRGSTQEIPKCESLRFSHQIPAFLLTEENDGRLRGFLELDSASLPSSLLSRVS